MSAARGTALLVGAVLAAGLSPPPVAGQSLAERVEATRDGTVRFSYEARPDVEICDEGIRMGDRRMHWRSHGWDDEPSNCVFGSVEVEVELRDGLVRDVDVPTRRRDRAGDARELGEVAPEEAVGYLMALARGGGSERAARDAVFPAILADVADVWREILALAKDRERPEGVRKQAIFWVGQEAASAATEGLSDVALDDDEEQEVREAAVFALSQRPDDEGLPVLMELARTADQAGTRRTAMFWLAQSDDPRVLAFFEEILLGRGGE